jgi:hypothetical protein
MSFTAVLLQPELDGTTVLYGTTILFVVSVLAGGVGNYLGIRLVSDQHPTYVHAVVSSVLSAAVWAAVSYALTVTDPGVTPASGTLVALVVWIVVLYVRYDGGIVTAIPAGVASWAIAVVTLYVVAVLTRVPFEAIGIPAV